ncbi:MAG: phosphoenolpyruvate--protein phosphotransferase [Verrucomicrobia bacterium]|nr:MAG: phosphoenolpyruvate--protein phosphotransferase [Verrucomicrobiota bacterium]
MPKDNRVQTELTVQGIPASPGIAFGQVFVYLQSDVQVPRYEIPAEKSIDEIARFDQALVKTRQQITKIKNEVEKNLGADEALIFDAHLLVLEDQALISQTIKEFETTHENIETCFERVSESYIKAFSEIDDEYLRERAGDIRDVAQRVLQNLLGQSENNLSQLADKRVVVANDLSPSGSASIDRSGALGLVTDKGSKTSHAVIVARSMKLPAVVGVHDLTTKAQTGDWLIVDGYEGVVILHPSEETLLKYGKVQKAKQSFEDHMLEANRQPAVTLDGVSISLMANIEKVSETEHVKEYFAKGVGLFRTEYLYLNSSQVPTEQEQFLAYKAVVEACAPNAVVIRTLDLGGDKPMPSIPELDNKEANPFMGYRAIRFCLETPELFKNQLRAILRASVHGKVQLMFPMISGVEQIRKARALIKECTVELKSKGLSFDPKIQIGAMIEIPSAATTADILAKECDFFSIGTNDLIQYLIAVDRGNDRVAALYEPSHPAVLRTLKHIVECAKKEKISVSVCGEIAGDPIYTVMLLGLGVDHLSMTSASIPRVKYLIRAIKISDAKALVKEALEKETAHEIHALLHSFYTSRVKVE